MSRRRKVKLGDIFAILVSDEICCYGQVVGLGIPKCYVIYDFTSKLGEKKIIPEEIVSSKILFLTHTVDDCIENGKWIYKCNANIPDNIKFPQYKVETLNGYKVTNHEGRSIRMATEEEIKSLKYRESVSPALLENAVKAKFNKKEWDEYYNSILYLEK